jgi:hypothetical protein
MGQRPPGRISICDAFKRPGATALVQAHAAGNINSVHEAAWGGYLRSREHGMVIVPCPHVQVVIMPLVLSSQAVSIRSATGSQ